MATATESATEKIPPVSFGRSVRVKWCGKSAPRREQSRWQGKPHAKQDQIGEEERPAPLPLPGRSLELVSNGEPRGMVATASADTETGLSIAQVFILILFPAPCARKPVGPQAAPRPWQGSTYRTNCEWTGRLLRLPERDASLRPTTASRVPPAAPCCDRFRSREVSTAGA